MMGQDDLRMPWCTWRLTSYYLVARSGFWGDISNGPFAAMGVDCDDKRLMEKRSDRHVKSSNDIAYYTMLQWLTAIENGSQFSLKQVGCCFVPSPLPQTCSIEEIGACNALHHTGFLQEDIHDFEYGSSVKEGGLARGFLSAATTIHEEPESDQEPRIVEIEPTPPKPIKAKVGLQRG